MQLHACFPFFCDVVSICINFYLSDSEVPAAVHKFGKEYDGGETNEERRGVVHRLVKRIVTRHKPRHV